MLDFSAMMLLSGHGVAGHVVGHLRRWQGDNLSDGRAGAGATPYWADGTALYGARRGSDTLGDGGWVADKQVGREGGVGDRFPLFS